MNITKKIMALCMVCVLLLGTTTSVSAKTLAQSFSGGTKLVCIDTHVIYGCKWKKTAWAQTKGYYNERHYVRAYIGGSSASAKGAWADTGRQYSSGNIYRSCSSSQWDYGKSTIGLFPMGYAKYGH